MNEAPVAAWITIVLFALPTLLWHVAVLVLLFQDLAGGEAAAAT
jgi:hypothetical protein